MGNKLKPKNLLWLITEQCNLRCKYCRFSQSQSTSELTLDEGLNLLHKGRLLNYERVIFSGGEPFLRDDLMILLTSSLQMDYKVNINTNGTLITESLAKELCALPLSEIVISLDSTSTENDFYRGFTSRVVEAIKCLINYKNPTTSISTETVVHQQNYKLLNNIYRSLKNLGVDNITFHTIHLTKNHKHYENLAIPPMVEKDKRDLFEAMLPWAKETGYVKYVDFLQQFFCGYNVEAVKCQIPRILTIIRSNGDVFPCFDREDLLIGNVRNKPLDAIIENEKLKRYYNEIQNARCLSQHCLYMFKFGLRDKRMK
ncbi:radical SAM protein [Thermodesulfobacteriota bacterium]